MFALLAAAQLAPAPPTDASRPAEQSTSLPHPSNAPQVAEADGPPDQGTIVVSARQHHAPGDPVEAVNIKSYAITQSVDKAFVGPVTMGYQHVVPSPIRSGFHNFIYNLREPTIFLNFMLQIKPGKAAETAGRFAINSTVGVAGLFDIAKRRPFHLPHRPNGFADSFGFYGIKPGPYMFVPLVGPTSLRDLIGGGLDRLVLPLGIGAPFNQLAYTLPTGVVSALDHRVEIDDRLNAIRGAENPYVAMRTDYLRRRQAEIDGIRGIKRDVHGGAARP